MRYLRFSLASLLLLLLVASQTVIADWQHADLHVRSIGQAVGRSAPAAELRLPANTCWRAVAGALAWLTLPASLMLLTAVDTRVETRHAGMMAFYERVRVRVVGRTPEGGRVKARKRSITEQAPTVIGNESDSVSLSATELQPACLTD